MSGAGAPELSVDASELRVAVIAGSWHEEIMSALIDGARATLSESGAAHELFRVAGAFELPLAAQAALTPAAQGGGGYDAVVCLGVIIRGGTPHFEYVCNAVTDGLGRVQLDTGRPVGFGVLTTDTEQQALDRSGRPGAPESKGREAAEAALHLAVVAQRIRESAPHLA
ncbi:6,7-dimethyl-8-ribityllumazine synthase [Leucobacter massiliensis]|uniref:6,7-dimethyl-8-ribityllumazine synthase n=1 Tax=Leucobacter massiliensis TaxID=1686285 RepID=A0A2S9QS92_9MICO|nr:6,7-dimethyl-8-ribityllumazine synthase [Leucobacter massiliensis]PRI12460.1 6,7-dimethyl-8-ribityllumazine synthase [Leucobacter massiliensis]